MKICKVKKSKKNIFIPERQTQYSAGYDICSPYRVNLYPKEKVIINTGLSFQLPKDTFGMIVPRSSIAIKRGLRLANSCAILDSDYTGELLLCFYNDSDDEQVIEAHERIAQMIVVPYLDVDMIEVDELNETERGDKGIGSTGRY